MGSEGGCPNRTTPSAPTLPGTPKTFPPAGRIFPDHNLSVPGPSFGGRAGLPPALTLGPALAFAFHFTVYTYS